MKKVLPKYQQYTHFTTLNHIPVTNPLHAFLLEGVNMPTFFSHANKGFHRSGQL